MWCYNNYRLGINVVKPRCYSILLRVYDANKIKIWLTSKNFNVKFLGVLKRKTPQLVIAEFFDVFIL